MKNDSRLAIFCRLVQAGPDGMTPTSISREFGIPASTLSSHLKELSHADLVTSTRGGRTISYCANQATMDSLLSFLTNNCCAKASCS